MLSWGGMQILTRHCLMVQSPKVALSMSKAMTVEKLLRQAKLKPKASYTRRVASHSREARRELLAGKAQTAKDRGRKMRASSWRIYVPSAANCLNPCSQFSKIALIRRLPSSFISPCHGCIMSSWISLFQPDQAATARLHPWPLTTQSAASKIVFPMT